MKRHIITCIAALMGVLCAQAESISIGDVVMDPGETKSFAISLTNSNTNLVSFQMDLYLPDGITINKSGCSLSSRFANGQELTIGKQADGVYRLTSTSFALTPISGTSGTIINLSLAASATAVTSSASIKDILFVDANSESVVVSDKTFQISVRENQSLSLATLPSQTYGSSYTLPSQTDQGVALTWTSASSSVATISGNVLTAKGVGSTTVTATQAGNSSYLPFTKAYTLTVTAKSASSLTISSISAVTYNGLAQTPTVTVKDGSTILTSGTHYTVAYSNNTNAGTATVTITGKGNYTGTKTATFTINPKNASNLTISSISAVTYTGSAQTPTVTVKDGSTTLTSGTDYTVAYSNNTNAGTATVTVTGKGNYTGTKTVTFTINAKNSSDLTISSIAAQTYTGSAHTPAVTVMNGTATLTNGTDYTVSYSNNTNAGTATVTITGMGNYTGAKTANFTIEKASLTIAANDYSIDQKDEFPAFEATYSGFVNGETESVMTTLPSFTCSAADTETPGTYSITPSGATAQNYDISYVPGTLTINAVENVSIVMATSSGTPRAMIGYSSKYGLDFTSVSDVKAYIAVGYTNEKKVLLTRIYVVPANTGVVLRTANPGVTANVPTTASNVYYANLLLPAVNNVTIQPTEMIDGVDYRNLMVGTDNSTGQLGFIKFNNPVTRSNNCYLRVPTSFYEGVATSRQGLEMMFVDSESTDAIRSLLHNGTTVEGVYDLQGRKVTSAKKGLYISNGKKIYVK